MLQGGKKYWIRGRLGQRRDSIGRHEFAGGKSAAVCGGGTQPRACPRVYVRNVLSEGGLDGFFLDGVVGFFDVK